MTWFKKNLLFTIIMLLFAAALGYEIYLILGDRKTALAAEGEFEQKIEEYQKLSDQPILPNQRNVQLTQEEIERQLAEMEVYEEALAYGEELAAQFADHPTSSTNALFDVQFFVEEYRQRTAAATNMSAESLANEFFGFQAYSQTGPSEDLIPSVYKQRLIVAHILDRLFEAEPEALVSVARPGEEGADTGSAGGGRGQTQAGSAGFSLDSKFSAAIPEVAQTSPYQVTFTGRTETLRSFINALASYDMPLIVRSVQVAPTGGGRQSDSGGDTGRRRGRAPESAETPDQETEQPDENIPLVADNLSRFTVAMEFIDLVPFENAQ